MTYSKQNKAYLSWKESERPSLKNFELKFERGGLNMKGNNLNQFQRQNI